MIPLLVALGAAGGAPARLLLSHWFDRRWPWGIWCVNVAGSVLLGWLTTRDLSSEAWALAGIGFCGGFTTYSTFAVQTVKLGPLRGLVLAAATVLGVVAGAALGVAARNL